MTEPDHQSETEILEKPASRVRKQAFWRVILHNDDYTPMDFVILLLEQVFLKRPAEAHRIMMQVHTEGTGLAGVYPHEVAETKADTVHQVARAEGYPLRASLESD